MTEHNTFFQEIQEELERKKLENFWKRYGAWIIAAAVTIIIATAGYTAWSSWRTEMQQKQTDGLIEILLKDKTDPKDQAGQLESYAQKNQGVAQSTFAQFHAANLFAKSGDEKKAIEIYDAIASDTKSDSAFRQLADLFSVELQMDSGDPVSLQKRLETLMANNAPFRPSAMEYTALLALRTGDKAKAAQLYNELSQDKNLPPSLGQRAADMARYLSE